MSRPVDSSAAAETIVSLYEQLAEYESATAEITAALGHSGSGPDDLRDAVAQITDRLLRGEDLDGTLAGAAEQVRKLVVYAHLGAWVMQGITQQSIALDVAHPDFVAMLNTRPPIDRVMALALAEDDDGEWRKIVSEYLDLFDRTKPCAE